ncbi:hypothetical protein GGI25_003288 [Coemansia spiralis]|uniref:CRA domain-containing protein n=2 Tax=Coemansia TaxID=4863 RepID=A0A9W8G8S1_9FUNG|nr:CTLH/CRA C-terminal to lish motif domain-containing protein [Coemansia spiralis]KAJ1992824.1 hypothetical protein EDC05_002608 [Coemansia umbellata]KAJ2622519.1 hypothetical protein GGI26_003118 [Coemansia sp. RSA 1358]KAJ2677068.1 hypothetical protein GGI25_003288 [Coemansia spiralis]
MSALPNEPHGPPDTTTLHMLIYSFLLHNNCGRTAKAFARTCGLATSSCLTNGTAPKHLLGTVGREAQQGKRPAAKANVCVEAESDTERANKLIDHHIECLRIRQSICSSIENGEPEVALDLLTTYFRAVLIPPEQSSSPLPLRREFNATLLRFRLDTQYYIELIANHQELDALVFGQRTLWRYPDILDTWLDHSGFLPQDNLKSEVVPREELKLKRAEIMQHITNVAALVAYPDPRKSSLAYLLGQERRNELAAAVNSAILQTLNFPREPAMVTLVRQLATTSACLFGMSSSSRTSAQQSQDDEQDAARNRPWVLDMFVNSESSDDAFIQ